MSAGPPRIGLVRDHTAAAQLDNAVRDSPDLAVVSDDQDGCALLVGLLVEQVSRIWTPVWSMLLLRRMTSCRSRQSNAPRASTRKTTPTVSPPRTESVDPSSRPGRRSPEIEATDMTPAASPSNAGLRTSARSPGRRPGQRRAPWQARSRFRLRSGSASVGEPSSLLHRGLLGAPLRIRELARLHDPVGRLPPRFGKSGITLTNPGRRGRGRYRSSSIAKAGRLG